MLQHVIKAEVLDLIFGAMNLLVRVLKFRFNDEGGRIAVPAGRCMVGAGIPALGLNVGNVAILMSKSAATLYLSLRISYLTVVMTCLINSVKPLST